MEIKVTEKIRKPRIEAKIKIGCRGKYENLETFMGNISQSGLFLETPKSFARIGEKIDLSITLPNSKETVSVVGKVVRIVGPNQIGKAKGFGIELLKIEAKQTFLFNRFLEELIEARGMGCRKVPRIDARITVEFSNPKEMGKCLSRNLSKGGIFLHTKTNLDLGEIVSLALIHPVTGDNLEIQGEIVHIRKSLESKPNLGFTDGIGIKFINVDKNLESKIDQFLKKLLIQKRRRVLQSP